MSCILRVSGDNLDVDALLASIHLTPDRVWHQGELRTQGKPNEHSGFTVVASDADIRDFETQLVEATRFLEDYGAQIADIASFEGVKYATLDFGIELRDVAIHSDTLTPRFLSAVANAGISVELSHYPGIDEQKLSGQAGGTDVG